MTLSPVSVVREEGKLWTESENVTSFLTYLELLGEFLENSVTKRRQYLYYLIN
jgi:hypothetical protein